MALTRLVGCAAGRRAREGSNGQQTRALIDDEFQAANVAAIDLSRLRGIAVVPNLGLTGRTLPRHDSEFMAELIALVCHEHY